MPSRFTLIAMGLAAPLWLATCDRQAQQETETGQTEQPPATETQTAQQETENGQAEQPAVETQTAQQETEAGQAEQPPAETQTARQEVEPGPAGAPPAAGPQPAEPAEPPETRPEAPPPSAEQPPPTGGPAGQAAPSAQGQQGQAAGEGDGEILVVPPEKGTATGRARPLAEAPQRRAAEEPGEPAPEAAGVASVAAYIGRWAEEEQMCRDSFWVFTSLRLETPRNVECDIESTEELEDGINLHVACTDEAEPLAEPRRDTMSITFPNLPKTDAMEVSGGPAAEEARTLARCPLG